MIRTKKHTRLLSAVMAFIMSFSMVLSVIPTTAFAAEGDTYPVDKPMTFSGYQNYTAAGGHKMNVATTQSIYVTTDSSGVQEVAYCVDHGKKISGWLEEDLDQMIVEYSEELQMVMGYGYSYKNNTFLGQDLTIGEGGKDSIECAFMATQLLIWEICDGMRDGLEDFWYDDDYTFVALCDIGKAGVAHAYRALLGAINEHSKGEAAFAPEGFYTTYEDALANANYVDIKAAYDVGTAQIDNVLHAGKNLKNFTRLRTFYGSEDVVYAIDKDTGELSFYGSSSSNISPLHRLTTNPSVYDITTSFLTETFVNTGTPTTIKDEASIGEKNVLGPEGETPVVFKIWRSKTNSPVVEGTLRWFKPIYGIDGTHKKDAQRRIMFEPGDTPQSIMWAAFYSTRDAEVDGVTKIWKDNNDAEGIRPNTIKVTVKDETSGTTKGTYTIGLGADGTPLAGTTVVNDNIWKYKITGIDQTHEYSITEDPLTGDASEYTTSYIDATLTVINEYEDPVPGTETIEDKPPEWTWPSVTVDGTKLDKEPGFDGQYDTPRGNGTLAAGFEVAVSNGKSGSSTSTMYADHNGKGASVTIGSDRLWSNISHSQSGGITDSVTTCDGTFATKYQYTYTATITVNEIVPEGYLSETESGTGNGTRTYYLTFTAEAQREVEDTENDVGDPPEHEHIETTFTEWEYKYTLESSDTGENIKDTEAQKNHNVANPVFTNEVKKGNFQLVKTYDEDLDQWTDINESSGIETYLPNSQWTLELVDGFANDSESGNKLELGGSEGKEYVQYNKIANPSGMVWGNHYRVVTDTTGTVADEANPLRTDAYGQMYIYDLPYGYYKLTELRSDVNEGYVLETVYFYITKDEDTESSKDSHPSQDVNDEVIENEIIVKKTDSETGKTVPYAGVAFRLKYLGYTHTNPSANPLLEDLGTNGTYDGKTIWANAHSNTYAKNGRDVQDEYELLFYTDATGRVKLPYALEYGVWQLEEVIAPYGYYIGDYTTGEGQTVAGSEGFNDTVAIYDSNGERVEYTENSEIIYNFYPFEVSEQDKGEIVVQIVEMQNNSTKGKIQITKVGEKLIGFTETDSKYGVVSTPVYEMKPLSGAVFEIVAAVDITLNDGYEAPILYDRFGNEITPELINFTHQLWSEAISTHYAELQDGTEAYITTERYSDNDYHNDLENGIAGVHNDPSMTNLISATLLSTLQNGVTYELVYEVTEVDDLSGIEFVTTYEIEVGLEYAAGGWNYSYFDITRTTDASDFFYTIDDTLPVIVHDGTEYSLNDYASGDTITLPDGSFVEIESIINTFIDEVGQTVELVRPDFYEELIPDWQTVNKYAYAKDSDTLIGATVPSEYDETSPIGGYHCYAHKTNADDFIFAIFDETSGSHIWHSATNSTPETEDKYVNEPDASEYTSNGWTLSVETVTRTYDDVLCEMDFTGEVFVLTKGSEKMYAALDGNNDAVWVNANELIRATFTQWRRDNLIPTLPGFVLELENIDFGYMAWSETEQCWSILVREIGNPNNVVWARSTVDLNTYLTREVTAKFDLNESKYSTSGFTVKWGDFEFTNAANHADDFALATMYNPSDVEATLTDNVGCETELSADGKTWTVKVVQPERQAWYELVDGIQVGITYLGGYTKTIINVPHDGLMPDLKWNGTSFEYMNDINPANLRQTVEHGNGNYVETCYDQFNKQYIIEIVSNATEGSGPNYTVEYPSGHEGYSYVVYDPEANAYRGQMTLEAITKTLVYQSGSVIETITTGSDGIAVSSELPLGTYYIREVDAGNGIVISTESYQVDLEYAGQYVPLVWGTASIHNEALNVTIDISKSFQEAYGSENYVFKAGAVFGVYNKSGIEGAPETEEDFKMIDKDTAEADSLLHIIEIGEDGFATASIKLPFRNDYYIVELDTLDGYTLSDVKYLFRVDEQTYADNLKFAFDHDGINGEINQSDLFETTVVIETLYQVPARSMNVNGQDLISDTALEETMVGSALVTNEVQLDRTITTIVAKDAGDTVITFENGATLTITVYSDGYTALFTEPDEDIDCKLTINKGNALSTTIKEEDTAEGKKLTFNPLVAYSGYTVDITDSYRAPTTVMTTKDDVRVTLNFNKATGARTAVLEYPKNIELPAIDATETWLTADSSNKTITVNMNELLAQGNGTYEYKTILSLINAVIEGKSFSYILDGDRMLTETEVLTNSAVVAKYDGAKATSVKVDEVGLALINAMIADMALRNDETEVNVMPLVINATDALGNEIGLQIQVELRTSENTATTLTGDLKNVGAESFPTYGESIFFTITGSSFEITTAGKACAYDAGLRNDGISVSYTTGANPTTTISHSNKTYLVTSENGTSAIKAVLAPNSTSALITMDIGSALNVFDGNGPVADMTGGYLLNPGTVLTVVANDGTLYTARLDNNGVFILHGEAIIDGTLATGTNAASATANGTTYYKNAKLKTDTAIEFSESITMARSSGNVSSISVKINSKSENHLTDNQENGTSTGRPDDIHNDVTSIEFEKADMGGKPLAGAVIAAYDSTGKQVFRGTTNSKGIALWTNVLPGTYTFREIQAPYGYELDSTVYTLVVYEDGTISGNRTLYNKELQTTTPTPDPGGEPEYVIINKSDLTDGKPVAGAYIKVWNKETGKVIFDGKTDVNGQIRFKKPIAGTYVFREEVAPEGYILNTEEFEFKISESGRVTGTLHITNEREPEDEEPWVVIITKTDATDASPVPGAEITIWYEDGTIAFKDVTDENGLIRFEVEKPGRYIFYETYAPDGYDICETKFGFVVHEDGSVTGTTGIKNIRTGTVVISKTDIIDGHEIPGAEITVYDDKGNVVFTQVTDEYGKIYFYPPAPGTYTFRETYAPDGYYINEETFKFTVDADGNITAGVTFLKNVPVGTVVIKKTDVSDGEELKDAEITIWNEEGEEVFRGFTDEDGRVYFVSDDWGPGTYTFRETIAPDGYILNEEIFTFHIDEDGVITGATGITNQKITSDVPKTGLTDWAKILQVVSVIAMSATVIGGAVVISLKKKEKRDEDNA